MKIKLDENLPATLASKLSTLGHDVDTVPDEDLSGHPDPDIWQAAQREQRFLITQDLDFSDIRQFKPGTHCGLLLIRFTMPGRKALLNRIYQLFQTEDTKTWVGCFIVVTEIKLKNTAPLGLISQKLNILALKSVNNVLHVPTWRPSTPLRCFKPVHENLRYTQRANIGRTLIGVVTNIGISSTSATQPSI